MSSLAVGGGSADAISRCSRPCADVQAFPTAIALLYEYTLLSNDKSTHINSQQMPEVSRRLLKSRENNKNPHNGISKVTHVKKRRVIDCI
ncbi:unnamed protein product [Colias eurytheme]|nr:unnamed protein product [Colias eurytheme]